ncbi:MAG: rhodanese-like domain-containing protein [Dokdonella sp.]
MNLGTFTQSTRYTQTARPTPTLVAWSLAVACAFAIAPALAQNGFPNTPPPQNPYQNQPAPAGQNPNVNQGGYQQNPYANQNPNAGGQNPGGQMNGGMQNPNAGGGAYPPNNGNGGAEVVQVPGGVNQQAMQALSAQEKQDFGIAPTPQLHQDAMHAPTPTSIPGGRVIDTVNLLSMLSHQPPIPVVLVDAVGWPMKLPNAVTAVFAAQAGSFQDQSQQQFGQLLQSATQGNRSQPVVVYCADPHCWMSYNAALRAINLGYQNVFWYRGGIASWQQAGLPTQPQQNAQGYAPQQGGQGQPQGNWNNQPQPQQQPQEYSQQATDYQG